MATMGEAHVTKKAVFTTKYNYLKGLLDAYDLMIAHNENGAEVTEQVLTHEGDYLLLPGRPWSKHERDPDSVCQREDVLCYVCCHCPSHCKVL